MASIDMEQEYDYEIDGNRSPIQYIPGILVSLTVIILLTIAGLKLMDPSTLPVRHVSVTGDFVHMSPVGLQERVSEVVRGSFFNVNVETIQNLLLEEPWVREVSVKRVWPDRITVTISEQNAVAQWDEYGLLNSDAVLFMPDKATFPKELPVLFGPENATDLVLGNLDKLRAILPEGLDVAELALSSRRSWTLKLNNGLLIRLGKSGVIEKTYRFFEYFPTAGLSDLEKIKYVDMRYTNGFIVRWNPDMKPELQNRLGTYGEEI
jgi:cell division protein FtsQ